MFELVTGHIYDLTIFADNGITRRRVQIEMTSTEFVWCVANGFVSDPIPFSHILEATPVAPSLFQ